MLESRACGLAMDCIAQHDDDRSVRGHRFGSVVARPGEENCRGAAARGWRAKHVFVSAEPSPIHLSQERLAYLVNLSRNSIIPILHEFVRLGFIEVKYSSITIIDVKGLSSTISE